MCQIILNDGLVRTTPRTLGATDAVEILEDGQHAGLAIIPTGRWNSPPVAPWKILDLPGVPAATFSNLKEAELDARSDVLTLRLRRLDLGALPAAVIADLNTNRRAILTPPQIVTIDNPRGT